MMQREHTTFVGVDLGGGKGKSTAVARLARVEGGVEVLEVSTTRPGSPGEPWYDENLIEYVGLHAADAVVAVDAPLTLTACVRCQVPVCPGVAACVDPAVVWLRTEGAELLQAGQVAERDQIAVVLGGVRKPPSRGAQKGRSPLKPLSTPYTQRACEVVLHKRHGILPRETLGQGMGPLTARAAHLVRVLAGRGFRLNQNLIEVYPKATITKLWGAQAARTYKRRADTWSTRAQILEQLRGELEFAKSSRMAREQCLQSDHCFDAVICAYTAYLWAREGWEMPAAGREVFERDGWIWAPP